MALSASKWSVRELALGGALFAALLILAALQFRWIDQITAVERIRLERDRDVAMERFVDDFHSEMIRLGRALIVGAGVSDVPIAPGTTGFGGPRRNLDASPSQRLAVWQRTTLYPQLVRSVVRADSDPLPVNLQALAERLPDTSQLATRTGGPGAGPGGRGGGPNGLLGGPRVLVDASVPALALPSVQQNPGDEPSVTWLIVEFDLDYMRETWIPQLVERNFGDDYYVRIVSGQGPIALAGETPRTSVIYQTPSLENNDEPLLKEEAVAGLFDLRLGLDGRGRGGFDLQQAEGFGPQARFGRGGQRKGPLDKAPPAGGFEKGPRVGDPPRAGRPPGPAPNPAGPKGAFATRTALEMAMPWRVLAVNKAGTLEESVGAFRRRNLGASFGMLLLMGVSIAMLLLSTRRSRQLARQQMEFVAGVTHELRTPLAVINSASQNLADGVATNEEQIRRYGNVIRDQGQRLTMMVEQVLRFAGLSAGQMKASLHPVDVREVIEQALRDAQPDLKASGSECSIHVDEELPQVRGDVMALAHGLRNLLSNAAKHGSRDSAGAQVTLSAHAIQQPGTNRREVEIRVADNGPGIAREDLPHIFEPFYRGRRATEDQVQGSGLGLSLVKKIIEAHHGTVQVVSGGEGTSFVLRLPIASGASGQ